MGENFIGLGEFVRYGAVRASMEPSDYLRHKILLGLGFVPDEPPHQLNLMAIRTTLAPRQLGNSDANSGSWCFNIQIMCLLTFLELAR